MFLPLKAMKKKNRVQRCPICIYLFFMKRSTNKEMKNRMNLLTLISFLKLKIGQKQTMSAASAKMFKTRKVLSQDAITYFILLVSTNGLSKLKAARDVLFVRKELHEYFN